MLSSRMKCAVVVGGIVGVLLTAAGLFALFFIPHFVNNQVLSKDVLGFDKLANGTKVLNDMTKTWVHPPYDMRLHIWMYSVENEQAFLAGREKLKLSQKGPYVFIEDQEKIVHEFTEDGNRVFYRNRHRYFFNQSLSCAKCRLSDKITMPNVLFQKLVDFAETSFAAKLAVEALLVAERRESPFVTTTVNEALFAGYDDPLISLICANRLLSIICKLAKIPDRIGFFYGQNNTDDGLYEVGTGALGAQDLGKMHSWNNSTALPDTWWDSPLARMINGTDGQLFPPMLQKDVVLPLFAAQACRSVQMSYTGDSEYEGVSSWRYSPPASMYDPSLPENSIFCHNDTVEYFADPKVQYPGCLPAGMLDLSKCQPGEPRVYLSQAHFFNSPKQVWSEIDGLDEPCAARDTTYVDIEPTAGVPIFANRVMQVNVGMKKGNLETLSKTKNLIVPVFWVNETASFDEATRDQLKNELQLAKHIGFVGGISSLVIGTLVILAAVLTVLLDWALGIQDEEHAPLVEEDDVPDDTTEYRGQTENE